MTMKTKDKLAVHILFYTNMCSSYARIGVKNNDAKNVK